MSTYGFLTEASIIAKKSKKIEMGVGASNFDFKVGALSCLKREGKKQNQIKRNQGLQSRMKKDEEQSGLAQQKGEKILEKKVQVYEKMAEKKKNASKLLVDFTLKVLTEEDAEFETRRKEFYEGKMKEVEKQRTALQDEQCGQSNALERLHWERTIYEQMKNPLQSITDIREKVLQSVDRRFTEQEMRAFNQVLIQIQEEKAQLQEMRRKREQQAMERTRKIRKLNQEAENEI